MESLLSGYEADFVELPSKIYECPVCLSVLREPYLLSCCGVKVCHPCISRIQNASPSGGAVCPVCRDEFTAMMDKQLNRLVLDLAVRCPLKSNGCDWVGELRQLKEHVDPSNSDGCQYVEVPCRNLCGGTYPRHALQQHEERSCSNKRPVGGQTNINMVELCELVHSMVKKEYDKRIGDLEETVNRLKREVSNLKSANASSPLSLLSSEKQNIVISYSPEVLMLMPKLKEMTDLVYYPKEGRVLVTAAAQDLCKKGDASYNQSIIKESIHLQTSLVATEAERIIDSITKEFYECSFSYNSALHSIEITSTLSHEVEKAKEVLKDRIATASLNSASSKPVATSSSLDSSTITLSSYQPTHSQQQLQHSNNNATASKISPRARAESVDSRASLPKARDREKCALCLNSSIVQPVLTRCCSRSVCKGCIDRSLYMSPYCPLCGANIRPTAVPPTVLSCLVCSKSVMVDAVSTSCCGRYFCKKCIEQALKLSPFCPSCNTVLRPLTESEKSTSTAKTEQTTTRGKERSNTTSFTASTKSGSSTNNIQSMMKALGQQQFTKKVKKTFGYKDQTEELRTGTCGSCGEYFTYYAAPTGDDVCPTLCDNCSEA